MKTGLEQEIMIKTISGGGTCLMFGVRGLLMAVAKFDEAITKMDMHQ